jgi:acyl dehydratase
MIGEGLTYEQHAIGATYRTLNRTVSETDIVNFVNLCGFTEPLFMDMEYIARESLFKRRAAPGALTFALSEGSSCRRGSFTERAWRTWAANCAWWRRCSRATR